MNATEPGDGVTLHFNEVWENKTLNFPYMMPFLANTKPF